MTRHKSRVARIRRARRGTRKQSGGFAWLKKLLGMKTADETTGAPAVPPTESAAADDRPWWKKISIFSSSPVKPAHPPAVKPTPGAPTAHTQLPAPAAQTQLPTQPPPPAAPVPPPAATEQGGGRKTRHRRRSPRHHRK